MSRSVFVLDITDFRPMNSRTPQRFLEWLTRGFHGDPSGNAPPTPASETAAARMQSAAGHTSDGIELLGAWYAVGITGHEQFRAFSLYECHGGWQGGWRRMMQLYDGVPDSLFLSSIDDIRFQARTVPLAGAPGCPTGTDIRARSINGPFAMIEFADVRPGTALDYLAAVRDERAPCLAEYGHVLAGLYEVAFTRSRACTLWTTDVDSHVRLLEAQDTSAGLASDAEADGRFRDWRLSAERYLAGHEQSLMLAAWPGPALSPT